jgi:hypothetical protein
MKEYLEDRKRPNLFRRIYLWWGFRGSYLHKDFVKGIKNIIYWIPIIWKDRDYDSHYIFEVLKHKLKSQAKYIGDRDFHERAQTDARNIRICVSLIEKIQDETYRMEYFNYAKERSWFEPCKDNPEYSTWEREELSENYDEYFAKYPLIYKRVLNGEGIFSLDSKKHIAMNISHINQDRASKLFHKIFEDNVERWWT